VSRKRRPELPRRFPVHVTLTLRHDVRSLRREACFAEIQRAFLNGHERFGMRVVEFAVESNHIHLVVEAANRGSLTRGMQGLNVRLARAINRAQGRRGKVFADRYHARMLKTPAEVRNAVEYVRHNHKKHLLRGGREVHPFYIDPYSSMSGQACSYQHDYWRSSPVVASAHTWMLRRVLQAA
jgi:REP-associated tyrosine transposase